MKRNRNRNRTWSIVVVPKVYHPGTNMVPAYWIWGETYENCLAQIREGWELLFVYVPGL
jgi:hypothetical protein